MRTKCNRMDLIKNLNLWGNDLQDISVLQYMPNLEVLSLSVNSVCTLADLRHCPKLSELYLRKNDIRDLAEVLHLKHLRQMRVLWLSDNPCATLPHYRQYVLHHLPGLTKFDSQDVTDDERRQAIQADVNTIQTCVDGDYGGPLLESPNPEDAPESIFEPISSPMASPQMGAPQRRHSANEASFEDVNGRGAPSRMVAGRGNNRRHQTQQQPHRAASMEMPNDMLPRSYSMPVEDTLFLERSMDDRGNRASMQAGGRRHIQQDIMEPSHAGPAHNERPLPAQNIARSPMNDLFDDRTPQNTPRGESRDYLHSPPERSPGNASYISDMGRDGREDWHSRNSVEPGWQERAPAAWPEVTRSPQMRRRGGGSGGGSSTGSQNDLQDRKSVV